MLLKLSQSFQRTNELSWKLYMITSLSALVFKMMSIFWGWKLRSYPLGKSSLEN